jgi:hypothetical protein
MLFSGRNDPHLAEMLHAFSENMYPTSVNRVVVRYKY